MANSGNEKSTFSGELYNLSFDSVEEDSNNVAWFSLIQNLTCDQLESLRLIFKEKSDANGKEVGLNREEFLNIICYLYGNSKYSLQSLMLFDGIISFISNGAKSTVTWNDFLDFLLESIRPRVDQKVLLNINKIESVPHTKRETIVKIVLIETKKYFCYTIISKHGRIGLYDGNLNFLTSYHVIMTREDITRSEDERRRRNRWVTDAIFCEDVLMFIVTNTARSIMIYEASGLRHVPYWLVLSTPNIVECLAYKCHDNFGEGSSESILFMGDCYGGVTSFKFLQPKQGFLRKKHNDKLSLFYWDELPDEKEYVVIKSHGRNHKDSIKQIKYCAKNNSIFTCSKDSEASVVQRHIFNKRQPCIFKMKRGASCFTICTTLKLLITGSDDGTIRIWNSVMVSKPIAVLLGHHNDIADMQMMENQQILLSCSRDGVFKTWEVVEHKCLQSFKIKFPSFDIEGKCIEWGTNSIFAGPKRYADADVLVPNHNQKTCFNIEDISERKEHTDKEVKSLKLDPWERSHILVTCCNYVASIRLRFDDINIEKSFEMQVLPPPPLQNSVLIPSSWKIQNKPVDNIESEQNTEDYNIEAIGMEELNLILDKDLLGKDFMKIDINQKINVLETKKLEMQKHVAIGAPYLVLDLFDITELKLSENLRVPNKKTIQNIVEKTEKILVDASTKDQVFSEPSSSRSKSSRSSLMEFPY